MEGIANCNMRIANCKMKNRAAALYLHFAICNLQFGIFRLVG